MDSWFEVQTTVIDENGVWVQRNDSNRPSLSEAIQRVVTEAVFYRSHGYHITWKIIGKGVELAG